MKRLKTYVFWIAGLIVSCSQTSTSASLSTCLSREELAKELKQAASRLEGTEYNSARGTDCSGMFHKLIDSVRTRCPENPFPIFAQNRSSRGIAYWYYNHDNFTIIRDPDWSGRLIEPGKVMFFGHGMKNHDNLDRQDLTIQALRDRSTGINHVAVVLDVEIVDDTLRSFTMFHGLNSSKPAAITTHYKSHSRHPEFSAYSHWNQPWVGMADLITPVKNSQIDE